MPLLPVPVPLPEVPLEPLEPLVPMLPLPEVPPLVLPAEPLVPLCEPLPLVSPVLEPLLPEPLEPVLPLEWLFVLCFFLLDFLVDVLPDVPWSDCELALVSPVDELPLVWAWACVDPSIAIATEAPSRPFRNLFIFMSLS
jgi:signal-induced proliferation-associated 1 like protein 3